MAIFYINAKNKEHAKKKFNRIMKKQHDMVDFKIIKIIKIKNTKSNWKTAIRYDKIVSYDNNLYRITYLVRRIFKNINGPWRRG